MGAADNFFTKAEQALKKRNYDYAIELWLQGLAIDPDRLDERQKLRATEIKRIQENGGNTMGGAALKFKKLGPMGKIKKLGIAKKWEEQILEIEQFLRDAPENPDQNLNLANAFRNTERVDSAIWAYNCVVGVQPTNVDALKSLGRLHEGQGDVESAIKSWERVKSAKPEDQEAGKAIRDLSAAAMMKQAEDRRAKSGSDGSFRDLLKDADQSEKLEQKQKIIRTADDAKGAIELKKEEIEGNPGVTRLWRELGDLHLKIKDFDSARGAYEKALEIDSQDLYASEKLGTLNERKLESQIEDLKAKQKANPDDAGIKAELDKALAEQQEFLLEEYARRVAAHPTDYSMKYQLGVLYTKHQRFDDAIKQFQNAAKDPKFATNSNYYSGKCFHAKKLFDLAIRQYDTAMASVAEPDSDAAKNIRYDLATAYLAKGDTEKALSLFEEIMAVDIGFKDVSQKVDEIRGM
ncbi:MAG: tetratricopeptide repeat protein [Planctomycetota bacterium]